MKKPRMNQWCSVHPRIHHSLSSNNFGLWRSIRIYYRLKKNNHFIIANIFKQVDFFRIKLMLIYIIYQKLKFKMNIFWTNKWNKFNNSLVKSIIAGFIRILFLYNTGLTLPQPVMRICVNYSTVYNDTLVAKGLNSLNSYTLWNDNKWKYEITRSVFYLHGIPLELVQHLY